METCMFLCFRVNFQPVHACFHVLSRCPSVDYNMTIGKRLVGQTTLLLSCQVGM